MFPNRGMIRLVRDSTGFKWLVCGIILILVGLVLVPGFFFGLVMSAYEIRGMRSTYATVVETNVEIPESIDAMTPAARFRLEQNATLLSFTAGGSYRAAMVGTMPASAQGTSVLIWYNPQTFDQVIVDSERNFRPVSNMLVWGILTLIIGLWMTVYDVKIRKGLIKHAPVSANKIGLGGGRHKGRF